MKTGPVGPVFFGYERILGKPVGQGEHEDDEPDAEGQPGDAGNDPLEIAVVNAPFDQVVIHVLRFGCVILHDLSPVPVLRLNSALAASTRRFGE